MGWSLNVRRCSPMAKAKTAKRENYTSVKEATVEDRGTWTGKSVSDWLRDPNLVFPKQSAMQGFPLIRAVSKRFTRKNIKRFAEQLRGVSTYLD